MTLRALHNYLGMLIAPTVLFLAFTGVLQVYNLHEAHGDYTPPALIVKLSSVHKDQVFRLPHKGAPPAAKAAPRKPPPAASAEASQEDHKGPKPAVVLLKAFFALVAVSLATSTLIGVWMGLTQPLRRRTSAILLAIGTVVPVVLMVLSA
jgi:hypothetical protein